MLKICYLDRLRGSEFSFLWIFYFSKADMANKAVLKLLHTPNLISRKILKFQLWDKVWNKQNFCVTWKYSVKSLWRHLQVASWFHEIFGEYMVTARFCISTLCQIYQNWNKTKTCHLNFKSFAIQIVKDFHKFSYL